MPSSPLVVVYNLNHTRQLRAFNVRANSFATSYSIHAVSCILNMHTFLVCYHGRYGGLNEGVKAALGIVVGIIVLLETIILVLFYKYKQKLHDICKHYTINE